MKKSVVLFTVMFGFVMSAFCGPHGGHCPPPPPPHHGWHGGWGPGGCNFWPGFVAGMTGAVIGNSIYNYAVPRQTVVVQQPTVITTPVVTQPIVVQQPVVQPVVRPAVVTQPAVQTYTTTATIVR